MLIIRGFDTSLETQQILPALPFFFTATFPLPFVSDTTILTMFVPSPFGQSRLVERSWSRGQAAVDL